MELSLEDFGFRKVESGDMAIAECVYLAKRQTWNTNRAVCVVELPRPPEDLGSYIKSLRNRVAFKVGFFPLFWGLGLQLVVIFPGAASGCYSPMEYVAKVDNQWAIVQSIFLVDAKNKSFIEGRSWGQLLTGKFQDAISAELQSKYSKADA